MEEGKDVDIALHLRFYGTVQGVGFRATVRHFCIALQVRGWVRNLEDGTVEAVMVGRRSAVDEAMKSITNPSRFQIERVETSEARGLSGPAVGFEIRR